MLTQNFKNILITAGAAVVGLALTANQYLLTQKIIKLEQKPQAVVTATLTPSPEVSATPSATPTVSKVPLKAVLSPITVTGTIK
jgi:hypothetical protein